MNGTVAASRVSVCLSSSIGLSKVSFTSEAPSGWVSASSSTVLRPLHGSSFPVIWLLSRDWRPEERIDSSTVLFSGQFVFFPFFSFQCL